MGEGTGDTGREIIRSCTNSRSIQIREPKLPMARRKIAGILCVFQDLSTQPSAIWATKLGAEAIGTASKMPVVVGGKPSATGVSTHFEISFKSILPCSFS